MSAIKFSQLPILPVITTGTIVPAVYNGVNYQINLGAIKAYSIPAWSDVINKPAFNEVAFSGDYSVLVNKPRIPTAVSSLTNDLNFVSQSALTWSNISGKPALALVATSGLWADIAGKPTWFNTTATGYLYSNGSGTLSFQPAQGGGISTATVTALIANSLTNYTTTPFKLTSSTQVVSLDSRGTLHTPLLIPKSFTAVLVPVYGFAPGYNPPGPTGGDAWSYEVHFVVSQDGTVETQIDSPVWASNPGYKNGDSWTFHEADHGIPGYTFTLALSDIAYPGPAGWTANVLASEPPEYPSTVKSLGAVKLSANDKNWIFAPGGNLVFPDSSIQKSATNIIQSATTPETISTSTLWYDTVGGRSYVYYDSSWVDASPMPAIDTTQLVNNGYSLSLDSAGIVNLPTFAGSPSIAIVQTASAGIGLNVNGTYFNFNQDGNLTLPGDLHGAEIFEPSPNGPISAGHQLNITPASNATDKKFEFAINQDSSGVFQNAALQLPTSENNKQVYLSFPGNDSGDSSSSIVSLWNQNTNSGSGEFNNAFNILANGKDIKLTAEARNGSYSTWTFDSSGNLTFPDGGRVVLHPYGNSYIESVDYGITTSTSSLNIFAGPDQKITLRANFGGTEKFWTFGADGKTSLASGVEIFNTATFNFLSWNTGTALIIADIPYSAGSYIYIPSSSDTSGTLGIVNTNTSGTIMLTQGTGNTTNQLFVNNSGTTINNILGGISKTWTFGLDGSLTFPDTSVQTGASISVADLKAIITTCTNFTEFKNAILGL